MAVNSLKRLKSNWVLSGRTYVTTLKGILSMLSRSELKHTNLNACMKRPVLLG